MTFRKRVYIPVYCFVCQRCFARSYKTFIDYLLSLVSIKPTTTTTTTNFGSKQSDQRKGWLLNLLIALFLCRGGGVCSLMETRPYRLIPIKRVVWKQMNTEKKRGKRGKPGKLGKLGKRRKQWKEEKRKTMKTTKTIKTRKKRVQAY